MNCYSILNLMSRLTTIKAVPSVEKFPEKMALLFSELIFRTDPQFLSLNVCGSTYAHVALDKDH